MPIKGTCRLHLKEAELLKSHYMPAALYPTDRHKSATAIREAVVSGKTKHVRDHLLCAGCEVKFAKNGEQEVLKWLAPKANRFSLAERMKLALPREQYAEMSVFSANGLGIDAVKFAYFALSLVWRGAVHVWQLPDGTQSIPLDLGDYEDTIRRYLVGETPFPHDVISIIVIVCSDPETRSIWITPCQDAMDGCENYRFITRGVLFRVMLGPTIPSFFRENSCVSAQCISFADCSKRVMRDLPFLLQAPVAW